MEKYNTIVDIVIVTYNQEKYISQSIESALSQIINFKYNIIIGDDYSSDSTSEICQSYLNKYPETIIYYCNKKNLGLVKNYQLAFSLCKSKYIAILEGDDYWTDPYKLQKQINILEDDDKIGIVHANCDKVYENGLIKRQYNSKFKLLNGSGQVFDILIRKNFITSVTVCFRKDLFDKYINFDDYIDLKAATIDYPLWVEISFHSKIFFINETVAVYRLLTNSLSNSISFQKRENFTNRGRAVMKYLAKKYNYKSLTNEDIDEIKDFSLFRLAIILNDQTNAIKYITKLYQISFRYKILYLLVNKKFVFRVLHHLAA